MGSRSKHSEEFKLEAVQQIVPELADEALLVAVLPGASRLDARPLPSGRRRFPRPAAPGYGEPAAAEARNRVSMNSAKSSAFLRAPFSFT